MIQIFTNIDPYVQRATLAATITQAIHAHLQARKGTKLFVSAVWVRGHLAWDCSVTYVSCWGCETFCPKLVCLTCRGKYSHSLFLQQNLLVSVRSADEDIIVQMSTDPKLMCKAGLFWEIGGACTGSNKQGRHFSKFISSHTCHCQACFWPLTSNKTQPSLEHQPFLQIPEMGIKYSYWILLTFSSSNSKTPIRHQ